MSDQNQQPQDGQQAAPAAQPRQQQYAQQPLPNMPQQQMPSVPKEYLDEMLKTRQEAEQLRAELKKRDAATEELKQTASKLTEQVALTEHQKKELEATRRQDAIRNAVKLAALEHNAIDPDELIALTSGQFAVAEDGSVVTSGSNPQPASAFVKAYLEKKPHLAKPRVASGSGSSPFTAPAPGNEPPPNFDLRTREGATAMMHYHLKQRLARPATTGR